MTTNQKIPTIQINAKPLAALYVFLSKNDLRFSTTRIGVLRRDGIKGALLVANDGHQIAIWHDKNAKCSEDTTIEVSPALIAASRTKFPISDHRHMWDFRVKLSRQGRLILEHGYDKNWHELFIQAGEGWSTATTYPKIERVLMQEDQITPGLHGCIGVEKLEKITKAAKLLTGLREYNRGCLQHFTVDEENITYNNYGMIITRIDGVPEFMIGTMPMKPNNESPAYPDAVSLYRKNQAE